MSQNTSYNNAKQNSVKSLLNKNNMISNNSNYDFKDKIAIKLLFQIEKDFTINESTTLSNVQRSIQDSFLKNSNTNLIFKIKEYEVSSLFNVPIIKTLKYYNSNTVICTPIINNALEVNNSNLKKYIFLI